MNRRVSRATVVAIALGACLTGGCPEPTPPTKEAVMAVLSAVVLNPNATCETLRSSYDLDYLEPVAAPDEAGLAFSEHFVVGESSAVLHVWHLPARLDRGTVVLSGGSAGRMACYLFPARLLVRNGWSVVMYDYQGFGESSGRAGLESLADDLEVVTEWARAKSGRQRVTLMGISVGTIPSVAVAVRRPDAVNAVVLDSPVALSAELLRFGFFLGDQLIEVLRVLDRELVSEAIIDEMTQPALIFIGEEDQITPPASVDYLAAQAGPDTTVARFPGLDHALGPYVDTALYSFHLETFLTRVWRSGPPGAGE